MPNPVWTRSLLAGSLMALALPGRGAAQEPVLESHFGAGFVVLAPHQYIGFSAQALSLRMGGIGIYVDAKFDRTPPSKEPEFDPTITAEEAEDQFGDELFTEEDSWQSVNVAVLRPVIPELLLYLGAGYSSQEHYRQYIDETEERGLEGLYWAEDPSRSGNRLNLLGGAFFRISQSLLVQFGVETKPRGVTVGGVYTVSRDRRR
jgi:hypothetical protein